MYMELLQNLLVVSQSDKSYFSLFNSSHPDKLRIIEINLIHQLQLF